MVTIKGMTETYGIDDLQGIKISRFCFQKVS